MAVIKRVVTRFGRQISLDRLRVTADRGLADARIADIKAWSRFLALLVIALLVLVTLRAALLRLGKHALIKLLRRVASRRRGRWELSLVNAILALLKTDSTVRQWLRPDTTLDWEAALPNVS